MQAVSLVSQRLCIFTLFGLEIFLVLLFLLLLLMALLVVVLVLVCWWYRCYWWCSSGGGCARDSGGGVLVGIGRSRCFLSNFVLLPFSLFCSCVWCWPQHPEGTTVALFWTWLMTRSASLDLGWFHRVPAICCFIGPCSILPLKMAFTVLTSQSNAQMTDTVGEMRWTRPPNTLSIPQPFPFVIRNS